MFLTTLIQLRALIRVYCQTTLVTEKGLRSVLITPNM